MENVFFSILIAIFLAVGFSIVVLLPAYDRRSCCSFVCRRFLLPSCRVVLPTINSMVMPHLPSMLQRLGKQSRRNPRQQMQLSRRLGSLLLRRWQSIMQSRTVGSLSKTGYMMCHLTSMSIQEGKPF